MFRRRHPQSEALARVERDQARRAREAVRDALARREQRTQGQLVDDWEADMQAARDGYNPSR